MSSVYKEQKNYQDALDQLEIAEEFDPDHKSLARKKAHIYVLMGKFDLGTQALQEAIDRNPKKFKSK